MAVREGGLCKGGEEPHCEAAYEGSRSDIGYFGASSTRHTYMVFANGGVVVASLVPYKNVYA